MRKYAVSILLVVSCAPQQSAQNPTPTAEDHVVAGCKHNVNQLVGTFCQRPPSPLPSGYAESVRRGYESQKSTCSAEVLAPLASCVEKLDTMNAAADPQAKARREAARPKADEMKRDSRFKALVEQWMQAFDGMTITCRQKDVSDSHARECVRWKTDLAAIEDKLRVLLVDAGFDARDLGELGLWPHG